MYLVFILAALGGLPENPENPDRYAHPEADIVTVPMSCRQSCVNAVLILCWRQALHYRRCECTVSIVLTHDCQGAQRKFAHKGTAFVWIEQKNDPPIWDCAQMSGCERGRIKTPATFICHGSPNYYYGYAYQTLISLFWRYSVGVMPYCWRKRRRKLFGVRPTSSAMSLMVLQQRTSPLQTDIIEPLRE